MAKKTLKESGLAWRPFREMSHNATYIDSKTGEIVKTPSETSEVLVDAGTGQMIDPAQLFLDNKGDIGRTNTKNQNVVLPYRYEYKLMPYHDTKRVYKVPVYNNDSSNNVTPEDAKRFGIKWEPELVGEDNWIDPSENILNYGIAGGIAFPTLTSSLVAGELGGAGFNALYQATHNRHSMEQDGISDLYNLGYWLGGEAGYKIANNVNKLYPWVQRTFGSKGSRLGHTMNQYMEVPIETEFLPYNFGWNPRQTLSVRYAKNNTGYDNNQVILGFNTNNFTGNPGVGIPYHTQLQSDGYLKKYLELLGDSKDVGKFEGALIDRSQVTRPFADYLESLGIDSSVFTEKDLNTLMEMRSRSVQQSIPENGRSAIAYQMKPGSDQTIFSIDINESGNALGEIQARSHTPKHPRANEVPVDMIERIDGVQSKGLSEDAYNAAIDYIKQTNIGEGLVSGDRLLSPEITYRVWKHYPNRKILRNKGHHSFGTGRDVTNSSQYETHEGPIVMLSEPSKTPISMKNNSIFHPDMIKDGKLLPPNWAKYGMYYSLFPLTYGAYKNNDH